MNIDMDHMSLLVTCSAQTKWVRLEERLNKSGYTLGYLNDQQRSLSVQQWLYKDPPNLLQAQYGTAMKACVGFTMMGNDGKRYKSKTVPRTAAGPDFRTLILNMGTRQGKLEDVTLRLYPLPEIIEWHYSYWPSLVKGQEFVEELAALHISNSFSKVYDVKQQATELRSDKLALVSVRFAGLEGMVKAYMSKAATLSKSQGGKVIRASKRKVVPLLEKMMMESV